MTNAAGEPNIHSATVGYGLINPLAGMAISSNGVFTWTPAQTQSPGTNTVTTMATNYNAYDTVSPQLTASNTFTVIVREVNQAPTLGVIAPQTVSELTTLTVTNAAGEPNIHSATVGYGLINPLAGMAISSDGVFTWTPAQTQSPGDQQGSRRWRPTTTPMTR